MNEIKLSEIRDKILSLVEDYSRENFKLKRTYLNYYA